MSDIRDRLATALADRYRVERELGAGGMATVCLAQDLKHDRRVAIKVLHEDLGVTLGPERFLAEIKTTAKLQHPHILPLLDSGEAGGLLFYAMPYVEGETLRARLTRETQLPIEDAVRIASEVADALGHAHGHGIVHRDIKPENILLQGGHALVADFGIALAVQHAGGARLTQTGLSLGTPQYMSPEQAMGEKVVDHRADVYALGAVTYEMLTGEAPFTGPTVQAIVAKVLTSEPERPTTIRKTIPPHIEAAVLRALAKLPADRFASVAELARALVSGPADRPPRDAARAAGPPTKAWAMRVVYATLLLVAAVGAYALGARGRNSRSGSFEAIRFSIEPPSGYRIRDIAPGLSADGRTLVFLADSAGTTRLFARDLRDLSLSAIAATDGADVASIAVSPDGEWVAYFRDDRLVRVPIERGQQALPVGPSRGFERVGGGTLAWAEDGAILAVPDPAGALLRIDVERNLFDTVRVVRVEAGEFLMSYPTSIAGGTTILFGLMSHDGWNLMAHDLRSGREALVVAGATSGWLIGPDRLAYSKGASLYAVRFDPARLTALGSPEPLALGVPSEFFAGSGSVHARGSSGVLAFIDGDDAGVVGPLVRVTMGGSVAPLGVLGGRPRYVPNGMVIAYEDSGQTWFLEGTAPLRRTKFAQRGLRYVPIWSADGSRIVNSAYDQRGPAQLTSTSVRDGSEEQDLSRTQGTRRRYGSSVTPDGKTLAAVEATGTGWDIVFLDSQGTTVGSIATTSNEHHPRLSPDGHWVAFTSDESGRQEVYVAQYPMRGRPTAVSVGGGNEPVWHPAGTDLYYRSGDTLRVVTVVRDGAVSRGVPRTVTRIPGISVGDRLSFAYDIAPDGSGFVAALGVGAPRVRTLTVLVTREGRHP